MNDAIGLIEVRGLASAVNVADIMLKVASVELLGIEKANGSGWMTIKVCGNVGAVKASVDSGTAKAKESDAFVSSIVIPRPAEGIKEPFFKTKQPEDSSDTSEDRSKPENEESEQTVKNEGSEEKKDDKKNTLEKTSVKAEPEQTAEADNGNKKERASSDEVVKKNITKPRASSRQKPKTKRTVSSSKAAEEVKEATSKDEQKNVSDKSN